jgi:hypothetical protein
MDWKDLEGVIGSAAPLLGGLIGGPAGAAVGSIVSSALGVGNTPDAVSQAISTNPDAAVKLRQIEADQATKLRELAVTAENNRLIAETAALAAVNATMQTEAKSDHWPTYSWRPYIGFCFGTAWIGVYLVLPILRGYLPSIVQPTIPPEAWMAVGGVLGVASWFRGRMQADPNVKTDNRG